jgi:Tfp pilus assembly protein PilE
VFRSLKKKFNHQGSFLIEVLISVMILSVGLTSVVRSYVTSLKALVYAQEYTIAAFLLENRLTRFVQQGYVDLNLNQRDSFDSPYENFSYRATAKKVEGREGMDALAQLMIEVTWESGVKERSLSASTYLYKLSDETLPFFVKTQ